MGMLNLALPNPQEINSKQATCYTITQVAMTPGRMPEWYYHDLPLSLQDSSDRWLHLALSKSIQK